MDLCFLDLETTGFEPKEDSIIEVSFVRYKDGKLVAEYDQVMQTDKSALNDFVSHLTGITQSELDAEGLNIVDEKEKIRDLIGDSVIVGHNIDFDIRFLTGNGIDISQNPRLDTHELARILLPLEESFALEVLSGKYGFVHADAHRAMSDVLASKDLYELLLSKIEELPTDYLSSIQNFLKTKTDWFARCLFLDQTGTADVAFYKKENFYTPPVLPEKPANNYDLSQIDAHNTGLVQMGENVASADQLLDMALALKAEGRPSLIVSSKLDYFRTVPKLPTPEVLLDPQKLNDFAAKREKLDNLETTFYLQCQLRHHLGFRGVFFFDLFFKMRAMWQEIKQTDSASEEFIAVLREKSDEKVLALSPEALCRFVDNPLFADRVLLFDESELAAEKILHHPTKSCSFRSWIDHADETIANAAQFFIGHFCRDVIEPKLGHQIGPFGAKILLHPGDRLPDFVEGLSSFMSGSDLQMWTDWCVNPPEKMTRWITYYPDSGELVWSMWHPGDWRETKEILGRHPKICFHRYPFREEENAFWRIFYGLDQCVSLADHDLGFSATLEIPADLVSHNSPDFNPYCSAKIAEIYREADTSLAVNFSSLDTMRHCYDDLTQNFVDDENFAIFGERVSGGTGKVLQLMQKAKDKKVLLCTQKMLNPALNDFSTETLVVQKFPFAAPHPLLEKIEQVMKQSGQSWWDIWVVTQLTANLHRRIANFKDLKKVVFLDPRENSRWGKSVLKNIFKY